MTRPEDILFAWACDKISTDQAKGDLWDLGYAVDFRQADVGATIEALNLETNEYVVFEI
jgi:hypothetical protein